MPTRVLEPRTRRRLLTLVPLANLALVLGCDPAAPVVTSPTPAGVSTEVVPPTPSPRPAPSINVSTLPGRLLFVSDANLAVWEHGTLRKLTDDRISRQPVWSPDSRRIAHVKLDVNSSDLWVSNADGSGAKQVTRNESRILNENSWAFRPTWSPDGSRLLFLGDQTSSDLMIWEIGTDGKNRRPFVAVRDYEGGMDRPNLTSDGKSLIATAYRGGAGRSQVWTLRLPEGPWKQLTDHPDGAYDPSLSPDGQRIAYTVRSQGSHDIWVMNLDGGGAQRVTYHGTTRGPTWSPDSQYLAYVAAEGNVFDIWVATVPAKLPSLTPTPGITPTVRPRTDVRTPTTTPVPTETPVPVPTRESRPTLTRQVTRQASVEAVSGVSWAP